MLSFDITDKHIRLVEGNLVKNKHAKDKLDGKKIIINHTDLCEIPTGVVENGYILEHRELAGIIIEMFKSSKVKEKAATVCINSSSILYKELTLPRPRASGEYAEWIIESMIRNAMSVSDEYIITYTITGETVENKSRMYRITAAACPRTLIYGYIKLFKRTQFKLKNIYAGNTCMVRFIRKSYSLIDCMYIQVFHDSVSINLYQDGGIPFSSFIKFNAADYNDKPDYLYPALFDNLFRIIHFLEQQTTVKEIQYCGIIQDNDALQDTLNRLNIPIRKIPIPTVLGIKEKREFDYLLYTALLGAFYKTDKKTENINLLKHAKVKNVYLNKNFLTAAVITAAVCVCAIFGAYRYTEILKDCTENEYKSAQMEYDLLQYEDKIRSIDRKKSDINSFNAYSEKAEMAKILFDFQPKMTSDIMLKLKSMLLPGMTIADNVNVTGYNVSAVFCCSLPEQPALYTEALAQQGYFENIRFSGYESVESKETEIESVLYTFNLTMRIKGGNLFEAE